MDMQVEVAPVDTTAVGLLSVEVPTRLISVEIATGLARACLLIEIGGFLMGVLLTAKREWRQYANPRLSHAEEMDSEFDYFDYWRELVAPLKHFPQNRAGRASAVRYRPPPKHERAHGPFLRRAAEAGPVPGAGCLVPQVPQLGMGETRQALTISTRSGDC